MTDTVLIIVFLLMTLLGVVARKTYYSVPVRELKRRAERHDAEATRLYRAVAYGNSLRTLLWLYIGLTSAVTIVLLARLVPIWVSLLLVGPLLWIVFSLVPASRVTRAGIFVTNLITPVIAWLLNYLHPVLSRPADVVKQRYIAAEHTGLYEREDLLELIRRQQHQTDNRLSDEELEIVERTLRFDDYTVADIMTPRKKVKIIQADDTVGPILIDEVHKSGQTYALVRESAKGPFVGTLSLSQLNLDSQGKVGDIMAPAVYYLHESDRLGQALHAFFVTNHSLFVVIDVAEEYVGVLTIADVLKQLLGHVPGDDFDQYTDPATVAARHQQRPKTAETDKTPVKTDDKVVE